MLRDAADDAERAAAHSRLAQARDLMLRALELLDDTPVATDCDGYLDLSIHNLSQAIDDVAAGLPVFLPPGAGRISVGADSSAHREGPGLPNCPWGPTSPS